MSTIVHFDFGTGLAVGSRMPRVALADVFELHGNNAEERLVAGGVVIDLQPRNESAPTRVEVKPGSFLIRLRTPEGRILMRCVNVEPGQDTALVILPKHPISATKQDRQHRVSDNLAIMRRPRGDRLSMQRVSEDPNHDSLSFFSPKRLVLESKQQRKPINDVAMRHAAAPDVLPDAVSLERSAVPRDLWSALPMVAQTELVTISNLPGFHSSKLVESKHDYMGIVRLQTEFLQERLSPDWAMYDITAKLVGKITAVQGAKLHGNRKSPFAKWKAPMRNRQLAGERADEGRGTRYFSLSYRDERQLSPLQVACVPGRWERRDGKLADIFANYYEREIGNTSIRALRVEVDDPDLGGLLDFLQQGDLTGSTRMLTNATELLYRKWLNPYASAAAGYVLVRAGQWKGENENWRQWILNLAQQYTSLPDGAILFTTLLLQSGSDALQNLHYEGDAGHHFRTALSSALEAVRRGPPLFRHGLKMMATNLAILEGGVAHLNGDTQIHRELHSASRYVRELLLRVDPNQPFCVFDVRNE